MKRNTKERNTLALVLGVIALLALIAFLVLSVGHVNNGSAQGGILGVCSIFGINVTIGRLIVISGVNWVGLVTLLLILLAGASSAFMSKYGHGWFYFSSVVLLLAIYFVFSYHSSWIELNCASQRIESIGAGQIVSGSLLGIMFFANFFAAYQQKNNY